MYYGELKNNDIANGIGVRVTLFVSGCTNHCEKCFQPQTWDFAYGVPFTEDTEKQILEYLKPNYIHGLTVLGGEPFEPANQKDLLPLLRKVKEVYPKKTIWMFSGFRYDDEITKPGAYPNCPETDEILSLIDVLVDGRYVDALRNLSLVFRGSSNQRLIDVKATRDVGKVVLWDEKQARG